MRGEAVTPEPQGRAGGGQASLSSSIQPAGALILNRENLSPFVLCGCWPTSQPPLDEQPERGTRPRNQVHGQTASIRCSSSCLVPVKITAQTPKHRGCFLLESRRDGGGEQRAYCKGGQNPSRRMHLHNCPGSRAQSRDCQGGSEIHFTATPL